MYSVGVQNRVNIKKKTTAILRKACLQGWPLARIWETILGVVPTIPRTDKNGSL